MISALTPLEFLSRSASAYRDCIAAVDGERRVTYSEMLHRVQSCGAALQRSGVAAGDRVAVLARNGLLPLEAHFAVPLIGAVLVPLNIRLQCSELATILHHSGAKILLGDADLVAPLESRSAEIPQMERIVPDYESFLSEGVDPVVPRAPGEEDVISINYTSGTTGIPKGVMYTHRGAYLNAIGEVIEHGLSYRSVYLWTLPMFHCNGWCFPWAVTAVGARHICLPEVNAERAVKLIEREGRDPPLWRANRSAHPYRILLAARNSFRRWNQNDGGCCAPAASRAPGSRCRRYRNDSRLRTHRDLWASLGLRVAHGLG